MPSVARDAGPNNQEHVSFSAGRLYLHCGMSIIKENAQCVTSCHLRDSEGKAKEGKMRIINVNHKS